MKTSLCTHDSDAAPIGRSTVSNAMRQSGGDGRLDAGLPPSPFAEDSAFGGVIAVRVPFD
jgi:hypothetical protein